MNLLATLPVIAMIVGLSESAVLAECSDIEAYAKQGALAAVPASPSDTSPPATKITNTFKRSGNLQIFGVSVATESEPKYFDVSVNIETCEVTDIKLNNTVQSKVAIAPLDRCATLQTSQSTASAIAKNVFKTLDNTESSIGVWSFKRTSKDIIFKIVASDQGPDDEIYSAGYQVRLRKKTCELVELTRVSYINPTTQK